MPDTTFAIIFVSVINVPLWIAQIGLYIAHELESDAEELSPARAHASFVLLAVAFAASALSYMVWAEEHIEPGRDIRRAQRTVWRLGIFVKSNFIGLLLTGLLAVFFTHRYPSLTADDVLLFTPLTSLHILLIIVAQVFVGVPLLLYVGADQFYAHESSKQL